MHSNPTWIIPVAAIALPLFLVPTLVFLKMIMKKREWRHLEKMEAIRTGMPVPAESALPGPGTLALVGAGVPAASVLSAMTATS